MRTSSYARPCLALTCLLGQLMITARAMADNRADYAKPEVSSMGAGVWRVRFGDPERFTPHALREKGPDTNGLARVTEASPLPFRLEDIVGRITGSQTVVQIPCDEPDDQIYGFGLDPAVYEQKGLRKWLAVSSSGVTKTGAGHGPMPYWLSTRGYGVYVDTARIATVHVVRLSPRDAAGTDTDGGQAATTVDELYAARKALGKGSVTVVIPGNSRGVDVFVFAGPTMREVVQRFNLFAGGGCMPPMYGLGMKYRTYSAADQATVLNVAKAMRKMNIPCDMLGLEPGWQTKAYPCSFVWSKERFPTQETMVAELGQMGFKLNLWEHAFVHHESPLFAPLKSRSASELVFGGLVVDFADPTASRIFSDYHGTTLIDHGVAGFKADECDNEPIANCTPFNLPNSAAFPSGIDAEQMLQMYGYLYQRSINAAFRQRNLRTWGDVRASTALAAPLPFNLYSDSYAFDQYLRQLVNASFSGLLWSPEVREAGSVDELLNRLAVASFAPQMCLNIWFMPHPLWEQYNHDKNCKHELLSNDEQNALAERMRDIVNLRYRLLPYLYAGFHRYRAEGLPPIRSLLLDFPGDRKLRPVDDTFMFGDRLLAAPFMDRSTRRKVRLPVGSDWIQLRSGERFSGGSYPTILGKAGEVPLFVRDNTLLPWAEPVQSVGKDTVFDITVKVVGNQPEPCLLVEDDGESLDFERGVQNLLTLSWKDGKGSVTRQGSFPGSRYRIVRWENVATIHAVSLPTEVRDGDPASLAGMSLISAGAAFIASSRLEEGSGLLLDPKDGDDPFAFHTRDESGAHVVIDLKASREIGGFSIVNRRSDAPFILNRSATLAMWLSDDGAEWRPLWEAEGPKPAWNLVLGTPMRARYVKIGLQESNFLHLQRVRIYGR